MVVRDSQGRPLMPTSFQYSLCRVVLMVAVRNITTRLANNFQYSLCRVVLMVVARSQLIHTDESFQYSLCRVVLMVTASSHVIFAELDSFSTRSVESF